MAKYGKYNKYNAKKIHTSSGVYDSKLEYGHALELEQLENEGVIENIRRQKSIRFEVSGKHICNYRIDFIYDDVETGKTIYLESKGFETATWRLKKKLMVALLPEIDSNGEYHVWYQSKRERLV